MKRIKLQMLFVLAAILIGTISVFPQKLKADDIVAKHLDSIGMKEKRAALKNIVAVGTASYNVIRSATFGGGKGTGNAVFLSDADKIYYGIKFDNANYSQDEIVFDGNSVDTAYISPGQRSTLGYFLLNNRDIVREGLFGGTLSSAWSLLNLQSKGAVIDSEGKKKVNGRNAYVISYVIKGNKQLSIKLYFDAENFQHLRTEYRREFPAPFTGVPTESSFQVRVTHTLTEDFSDYKTVNGLTLPYSYKINLLLDGKVTDEVEWNFAFSDFRFNQKIDPKSFEIK